MKNKLISIISIMAFLFISLCTSAQSGKETSAKAIIKVANLHCNGDMPTIKKQLLNQDGIEEVLFTGLANASSEFTISYIKGVISREQIEKAIETTPGCDDKNTTPYKVKREEKRKMKKA